MTAEPTLPPIVLDAIEAAAIAVRDQPLGKAYSKSCDDYQMSGVEHTLCDMMDHETTLRLVAEIRRLRAALEEANNG